MRPYPFSAIVTSAAKEFMKVCILVSVKASTNMKHMLLWTVDGTFSSVQDLLYAYWLDGANLEPSG